MLLLSNYYPQNFENIDRDIFCQYCTPLMHGINFDFLKFDFKKCAETLVMVDRRFDHFQTVYFQMVGIYE